MRRLTGGIGGAMANLILPNGQTIQTDNPAEIAEFMARGAQDQSAAVAAKGSWANHAR